MLTRRLAHAILGSSDLLIRLFSRLAGLAEIRGHHVYGPALGPDTTVVDLGAHRGEFSLAVTQRWGARCLMVEAAPALARNLPCTERLKPVHAAVSGATGSAQLYLAENPEASSLAPSLVGSGVTVHPVTVPARTLKDLVEEHDLPRIDLLKVDIEGAELDLFASLDDRELLEIGQITVEFHDFLPGSYARQDARAVAARLEGLGFLCSHLSRPRGNYSDVLFVGPACGRPGVGRRIALTFLSLALAGKSLLERLRAALRASGRATR